MTMSSDLIVSTVDTVDTDQHSYVDWPAIIAGIVLASAISLVLLTFGSAIGLSFANFHARAGVSPVWIAIAAGSWLLWVQISSFMAGGYLTGRMRRRHAGASEHEADMRDGAHGLLVWAGALVVGAVIAVGGLGAAANAIGSAASTLTTAASNVAGDAGALDPNAYFVDTLFRPAGTDAAAAPAANTTAAPATPAPAATPVASATSVTPMTSSADQTQARSEAGRIFGRGVLAGEVPAGDKAYLAQLVSANTGMSQADASARVDQVMAAMEDVKAKAAEAADAARRNAVIAAFLTAASLLVSAIGAYWAAQKGGNHRDQGVLFVNAFRRF